jgi:hypothetical protein
VIWLVLLYLGCAVGTGAQLLAPGDLAQSHAELEGLSNCTKCHAAGKKVPQERCLACHEALASRLEQGAGYHAQVTGDCVDCHSDHRGVEYEMIRWDSLSFDHDSTGYRLLDKHTKLACAKCHTQQHTYLGLTKDCVSCHADEHRAQFTDDCLSCHTMAGWQPATGFLHDEARYSLQGRHAPVACGRCHGTETDDTGSPFSRYRPVSFAACVDCHADQHEAQFDPPTCTACHDLNGFTPARFDHEDSRFALVGKHRTVACDACHQPVHQAGGDKGVTYRPLPFARCGDCHSDVHEGQFNEDCVACHSESGWQKEPIDHEQTRFPLRGKHTTVACATCHGPAPDAAVGAVARFRGLPHDRCADCHTDTHAGQFEQDCAACHQVTGWQIASFDHGRTRYPLSGKHVAVSCESCHRLEQVSATAPIRRWREFPFATCSDCHPDAHAAQFDSDCAACHRLEGFTPSIFAHEQARFALDGAHVSVPCGDCHKAYQAPDGVSHVRYRPLSGDCGTCHE